MSLPTTSGVIFLFSPNKTPFSVNLLIIPKLPIRFELLDHFSNPSAILRDIVLADVSGNSHNVFIKVFDQFNGLHGHVRNISHYLSKERRRKYLGGWTHGGPSEPTSASYLQIGIATHEATITPIWKTVLLECKPGCGRGPFPNKQSIHGQSCVWPSPGRHLEKSTCWEPEWLPTWYCYVLGNCRGWP